MKVNVMQTIKAGIKQLTHSVRAGMVFLFVAETVLILIISSFFSYQALTAAQQQIKSANTALLSQYASEIDAILSREETFAASQYLNRSLYLTLENADDPLEAYNAAWEAGKTLEANISAGGLTHTLLLFSPSLDSPITRFEGMDAFIPEYKSIPLRSWTVYRHDDQSYLVYRCRIHETDLMDVIPAARLVEDNTAGNTRFSGFALYEGDNQLCGEKFTLHPETDSHGRAETADSQSLVYDSAGFRNYELRGFTTDSAYLRSVSGTVWMSMLIIGIVIVMTAAGSWMIRRMLVRPLKEVGTGIEELKKGNFGYQLKDQEVTEFDEIVQMYSTLGSEIESLKIDMYEEQLEKSRFEMLALQRQLDPHFFINCLNNLRTLHLLGRQEEYQQMNEQLSAYLRAILSQNAEITLMTEIERCENYVSLQNIRYRNGAVLITDIPEELEDLEVPAHFIQTFLENSFKYGMREGETLKLQVRAVLCKRGVEFLVLDNGKGYDPQLLEQLNSDRQAVINARECVGIFNVRRRLKLLYGPEASLEIYNDNGACARIVIPDGEVTDEYSDD